MKQNKSRECADRTRNHLSILEIHYISKKISNIGRSMPERCILCAFIGFNLLSGRFGDSCGRAGDLVCTRACTKTRNNETKWPKRIHRNDRNETTETSETSKIIRKEMKKLKNYRLDLCHIIPHP